MKEEEIFDEDGRSREVVRQGHRLTVDVKRDGDDGWLLAIVTERGVITQWTEPFPTAEAAMEAGVKAAETDDLDEFMGYDDFGYLYDS
jgi:mannose/cellobiose epimerase-like protein (N-acyl-D-glucosamine 2-epimerase family)